MKTKIETDINFICICDFYNHQSNCCCDFSEETPVDKERYAKQTYTKKVYNFSDISGDNNIVLQSLNSPNQNISTVNIIINNFLNIHGNNNMVLQNSNIANLKVSIEIKEKA